MKPADATYQRDYFADPRRTLGRMAPVRTPYVERHLEEVLAAVAPAPGARVLELGCGMGRFTRLLAERGLRVTAVDLSPTLLELVRALPAPAPVRTVCCDAAEVHRHADGPFDAVVGFFFLHHLADPVPALRSAAAVLAPGGTVAFAEPNGWNPLFYLQIALTPGMTFRGDGGVAGMRAGRVLPALRRAGFGRARARRYGLFPPRLANLPAGRRVEARLERLPLPPAVSAFQLFSGVRGD